ncbi:putative undecaprenyl diphosphate synthase-domain-containing protein [Kickxella alabastrina]|uniref:putative undecaprenyl diphosphate synthase-domain-containing protein n=1 Tax=Kickxella alabastrina TaxID=61397 RepID=UPI0022201E5A|nr:putative undecaprenyl diphosphate synthase-domain-containing protein [Kickxella alabastrina]KAI7828312.1 putative undecaprenyl diphosphate synthase-domain-containing protein [Kickxella alabastrina]KAJ1937483.1 cis-prenyltransferase [Kickxella alabastrina]
MSQQSEFIFALSTTVFLAYVVLVGTHSKHSAMPLQKHCRKLCSQASKIFRKFLVHILQQGPIPKHVAFIMDGNRRFARKSHQVTTSGHVAGFHKLANVLEWCNDLGIKHVSVFAFAINNFNRSEEEVSALMHLAKDKLKELADNSELVRYHGARIRIVGNKALLPSEVRQVMDYAEKTTQDNKGMTLNVCFPYSSTDEMTSAIRALIADAESGKLQESEISEGALESRLQIPGPDLDILVRTSGQIRFSNFMLWQSSKMAYIQFIDVYWPEFSLFHMLSIMISWQCAYLGIEKKKQTVAECARPCMLSASVSDDETCCSEREAA